MRQAQRGDPGIVYDPTTHPRPLHETAQHVEKVVGLAEQTVAWRGGPGFELLPRTLRRRCRIFPNAVVCHHTQKFVAARPGNRSHLASFGKRPHNRKSRFMHAGFFAVGVDEQVRIGCNHRVSVSP